MYNPSGRVRIVDIRGSSEVFSMVEEEVNDDDDVLPLKLSI
jgi:hypothetical protein